MLGISGIWRRQLLGATAREQPRWSWVWPHSRPRVRSAGRPGCRRYGWQRQLGRQPLGPSELDSGSPSRCGRASHAIGPLPNVDTPGPSMWRTLSTVPSIAVLSVVRPPKSLTCGPNSFVPRPAWCIVATDRNLFFLSSLVSCASAPLTDPSKRIASEPTKTARFAVEFLCVRPDHSASTPFPSES